MAPCPQSVEAPALALSYTILLTLRYSGRVAARRVLTLAPGGPYNERERARLYLALRLVIPCTSDVVNDQRMGELWRRADGCG